MAMRKGTRAAALLAATVILPVWGRCEGQAVGGGALGLYSGAMLGTVGTLIPCAQSSMGAPCLWIGSSLGATVGMVSGAALGAADPERLGDLAASAGIGVAVGVAAGLALVPIAQRFGWKDVATLGLLGGAVGASPAGAGIGLAAGGAGGLVLHWLAPESVRLPEVLALAAGGMAVGALAGWVVEAHRSPGDGVAALVVWQVPF